MSSFQKSIMNSFFSLNSFIFFYMIFIKGYHQKDNSNFENVNVEYDFTS
jgi:hypothetical protein